MKNILTSLLNNLNKNNIFKTYEALKANLSNTNYAGYLRDFYTKEEAQAYAVKINCNEYIEREWKRLEKQDDEAVLFLTNTLRFEKVDEQTMKNLISEMIEEMETTPVEEAKEEQQEEPKAKKEQQPTHSNNKDTKPTTNNQAPEEAQTLTEGEKLEKIQQMTVEALKKLDKENQIDFNNYAFIITKEYIMEAEPLDVLARPLTYKETGLMGFRIYINITKIDEITPELIEKEAQKGYKDIVDHISSFKKQEERAKKIKEAEEAGLKMSVDTIKEIMEELDQQTGLNGASLPIFISGRLTRAMAYYRHMRNGDPIEFKFSKKLLTYGTFEEIKDVIIHEYCHYWQHMLEGKTGHNKNFKALCQKLGGSGSTYFSGFSLLGEAK